MTLQILYHTYIITYIPITYILNILFVGHPPGEAIITVACGDTVISEPVIFTYKEPATEPPRRSTPDLGSRGGGGGSLKHRLLHRLLNLGICSSSHLELFYEVGALNKIERHV